MDDDHRPGYALAIAHLQGRAADLRQAVHDGHMTLAALSRAQCADACADYLSLRLQSEGGKEDDLLRKAADRLNRLSDAASDLIAERDALRAQVEAERRRREID